MHSILQQKRAMRDFIKAKGMKLAPMNLTLQKWGKSAKTNAYRITKKYGKKASTRRQDVELVLWPNSLEIINKTYKWAYPLATRIGPPGGVVVHHAAAKKASPDDIHRWHLANGWAGFGYTFEVTKKGKVYRGRPEWAIGGHCLGYNSYISIVFEGNFQSEVMSPKQLEAGQKLVRMLKSKYSFKASNFHKHSAMPGNSTSCPGKNFPFAKLVNA